MATAQMGTFEFDNRNIKLRTVLVEEKPTSVTFEVEMSKRFNPTNLHPRGREGFRKTLNECIRRCAGASGFIIEGRKNIKHKGQDIKNNALVFQFKREKGNILIPIS